MDRLSRLCYRIFKTLIDLPNDVPSHDTISRVIGALDVDEFYYSFTKFTEQFKEKMSHDSDKKSIIAIDGKTMRGSLDAKNNLRAKHIVSAWSDSLKLCLGQIKTEEKSNEITAIPELLSRLDLGNQIITIDA